MKTGLIGLGRMGLPMARNLYQAGYLQSVWNRSLDKSVAFSRQTGVLVADDPEHLAQQCELIVTSVSADQDLLEVISSLLPGLQPNSIIVDTSTVGIETVREAAQMAKGRNCYFLDAPVSGGVEGARNGTLSVMVGGEEQALERVMTVLECIAARIIYMGETGNGQATKAVNQIMAAGINQAVTEALAFGEALGLDMDKVIEVVGGGAAGNWFLSNRGPSMVNDTYDPGFKVALHHKDLELCRKIAESLTVEDTRLPIIEMTLIHYRRLMEAGYGEEDISSLYRHKKKLFTG